MKSLWITLLLSVASVPVMHGHESPVDHVDREFRLNVADGVFHVSYRVGMTERAALLQLAAMDTNTDGQVTDAEATAFFAAQAKYFARLLMLQVEGRDLPLTPAGTVMCDPKLGQTYTFTAHVGDLAAGSYSGRLIDGYSRMYPGAFRWISPGAGGPAEIRVESVSLPQDTGRSQSEHAEWIQLTFNVVVPQ